MGFADDINKFKQTVEKKANNIVRTMGIDAYQMITTATPVKTGALRANWWPSIGNQSGEVDYSLTGFDGGRGAKVFASATTKDDLWITNNMPYARVIEYKGSTQGPPGQMIAKTVIELKTKYGVRQK